MSTLFVRQIIYNFELSLLFTGMNFILSVNKTSEYAGTYFSISNAYLISQKSECLHSGKSVPE